MLDEFDVVIAGAGLAGSTAAYELSQSRSVLLLDADEPAAGASGMAAGIVNPLPSLWAKPVWRMAEAVEALDQLLVETGAEELIRRDGLLRPAANERQVEAFRKTSESLAEHASWWTAEDVANRYPDVVATFGALWNRTAAVLPIPELVRHLVDAATRRGASVKLHTILMGWEADQDRVRVRVKCEAQADDVTINTRHLLLCVGREYLDFEPLTQLRLHPVKGQLIRVERPRELGTIPHLAGRGYVMVDEDSLVLGGTFEHQFCSLDPDPDRSVEILRTVSEMVPMLENARVLEARAGVRVTVPGIRLPMLGPLPDQPNVWVFTGLGSKGLLMAPMLARRLPEYLQEPSTIPSEVRVRRSIAV